MKRLMSERDELEADGTAEGKRLDLFIGEALKMSRSKLKNLFEADAVRVNGFRGKKGQTVRSGDKVVCKRQNEDLTLIAQPGYPVAVLKSDDYYVFVDKPSGMPSHTLRPGETGTLANALIAQFPECAQASDDPREGGICHRLDTETSGILLAARSKEAWQAARNLFTERAIDKRYFALVNGPLADQGVIELNLKHRPGPIDRMVPDSEGREDSRPARSSFRIIERQAGQSWIEVKIETGVLHQVRAHLAAIGAPLMGDELYGGEKWPGSRRFFLHAHSLEFVHPFTGQSTRAESPLPPELHDELKSRGFTV